MDVDVDAPDNLYVVDFNNDRVLQYDAPFANDTIADRVFGQFNNLNSNTYNNGGTSANSLASPVSVAVDPAGNVYIGDRSNTDPPDTTRQSRPAPPPTACSDSSAVSRRGV